MSALGMYGFGSIEPSSAPPSSSTMNEGEKKPPVANNGNRPLVDVLDERDLRSHMDPEEVAFLLKASEFLRVTNASKHRIVGINASWEGDMEIPTRDLLREKPPTADEPDSSPLFLRPLHVPATTEGGKAPPKDRLDTPDVPVIITSASLRVVECSSPTEMPGPILVGCTIQDDYLRVQSRILPEDLGVKDWVSMKQANQDALGFCTSSRNTEEAVGLMEQLMPTELRRMPSENFLTPEGMDHWAMSYTPEGSDREYCCFPEEHGMSQAVKRFSSNVTSGFRIFTLDVKPGGGGIRNFIRMPRDAYENAKRLYLEDVGGPSCRETRLKNVRIYAHCPLPKLLGTEKPEEIHPQTRRSMDLAQKILADPETEKQTCRIRVRLQLSFIGPTDHADTLFAAHPATLGYWVPGVPYFDPLMEEYFKPKLSVAAKPIDDTPKPRLPDDKENPDQGPPTKEGGGDEKEPVFLGIKKVEANTILHHLVTNYTKRLAIKEAIEKSTHQLTLKMKLLVL